MKKYGVALDIGTTTVVGGLIDLASRKELAVSSRTNPQTVYGEDVISRIDFAINKKGGLDKLHGKIIRCINEIVRETAREAKINLGAISDLVMVGNTTMEHLALGISPVSLATAPYRCSLPKGAIEVRAKEIDIRVNKEARVRFLPVIGGFVGSDLVAVVLKSRMTESRRIKLAVDIGANGEIAIGSKKELLVASTAAGPAFEGGHVKYGMRAQEGAIESVKIGIFKPALQSSCNAGLKDKPGKVKLGVIGKGPPKGICGSGLIEAAEQMLKSGLMDEKGRIEKNLTLYKTKGKRIEITQKDIRELQLAKAAIRAGIVILMKKLKANSRDLSKVFLAGAFGNYVKKEAAARIGLVPKMDLNKVRFIGNAAFEGAKMCLCSPRAFRKAESITELAKHVNLFARRDFREEFIRSMEFC